MILAGDIGGTTTRLAVFDLRHGRLAPVAERSFPSREYPGLEAILERFEALRAAIPTAACFGVPGPVRDGRCVTTNLPWVVDARSLERPLRTRVVVLLNDLEAHAHGIGALAPEDLVVLNSGVPGAAGNAAVISAGTGLGEAGLFWDGSRHHPFACEGGHADFSPADDLEDELLRYLRGRHGHVSWERVLSGPGLLNLYEFLRDTGRGEESAGLREALGRRDPAAVIVGEALADRSGLCGRALDLFMALYGAEAGNLALKVLATGGVYVGGGIAPKIIDRFAASRFMEAFAAKGRMSPLLQGMPVKVVRNERTALLGAARRAALASSLPS